LTCRAGGGRPRGAAVDGMACIVRRAAMPQTPLVSIVMVVKNGMPYVSDALTSIAAQTYRHLELVVQDGGSTDGTLEVIAGRADLPPVALESGPDTVTTAFARALARTRGDIVGSVLADDALEPDAVAHAVAAFAARPELAALYGANRLIDGASRTVSVFEPAPFDVLRLLAGELVPPFASAFFQRAVCGPLLTFDPAYETCAEFDLWLRLAHLPIARIAPVLGVTRRHPGSFTCRAEMYERFVRDKTAAVERFLGTLPQHPAVTRLRDAAVAGHYVWAAESLYGVEGDTVRFRTMCARAEALDPQSARLAALRERVAHDARRTGEGAGRAADGDAAAAARAEQAALAERLARMCGRRTTLDPATLGASADALAEILNAPDPVRHVLERRGELPAPTLPLLVVHLARAWGGGDPRQTAILELLFALLVRTAPAGAVEARP